jgi:sugar lactone lactonase YvrE
MSLSLARAGLLLVLLAACRTTAPSSAPSSPPPSAQAQSTPAPDPLIEGLSRLLEAEPTNGAAAYMLAARHAQRGEDEQALRWLRWLVEGGWSFAPLDADFGALTTTLKYRKVASQLAANEPQVARSRTAFTLAERDLIPEGIAHDPVTDTFFVSSISKRKVIAISRDGKVRDFTSQGQDGLWSTLGLKVDATRRHLWVASFAGEIVKRTQPEDAGRAGLFQYDLGTGALLHKYTLDKTKGSHLLNDVAISAAGDVFVTDSEAGSVLVLRAGTRSLVPLVPEGALIYPNGLALSEDGARLYVAHFSGLVSVDPATGQLTPVQAPRGMLLQGIDGLTLYQESLIAIQNSLGRGRLSRFYFGADPMRIERVEVLESGNPLFTDVPTTGTMAGDAFVYIANSQLHRLGPEGELPPVEQLVEPVLLQVELGGRAAK